MNLAGETQRENKRLTWQLAVFTAGAFAFGWALIPLYSVLCEVTGIGNQQGLTHAVALSSAPADPNRLVTMEFLAQLPSVGNWEFRPVVSTMQVHPGKLYEARFYAHNLTGHDVLAQAIPDISPGRATAWFHKTECFCFTPQSFHTGEAREMKVRFYLDSSLPAYLDRLTLSYTFYDLK